MMPDLAEEETSGGGDKDTISKAQTAEWIAICRSRGVPARWIDEAEARQLEPALGAGVLGAIDFPNEAQVRNPWLARALIRAVSQRGGRIVEQARVEELVFDAAGRRVTGVKLINGTALSAGNVAICTGAWTGALDCVTKLAPELKKIQPVRGEILCYEGVPELARRLVCERNHYFVPRGDGVLLVGATHERAGFDASVTAHGTAELEAFAHAVLPALKSRAPAHKWAGLRPGMKGRHPLIGALPGVENVFVSAGHYRNGVTLAPASAELLLAQIVGRKPQVDPGPWLPNSITNYKLRITN
jgi:glycine oxidase